MSKMTAEARYIMHRRRIDDALQLLALRLDTHRQRFETQGKTDWGFVGDLDHIATLLEEMTPEH